jgi:hypothetical protein
MYEDQVEAHYVALHAARAVQLFVSMGSCIQRLCVIRIKYVRILMY